LLRSARARCEGLNDLATTSPLGSRSTGTRQPARSLEPVTKGRYPAC